MELEIETEEDDDQEEGEEEMQIEDESEKEVLLEEKIQPKLKKINSKKKNEKEYNLGVWQAS